jgi:membrane protease YdiL (CAAX protease family)
MGSLQKPAPLWLALPQDTAVAGRLSAIGEPAFVLIAGTLLSGVVLPHLHLPSPGHYLFKSSKPDFFSAATVLLVDLAVLYAFVLSLAALLGLWRGRSTLASYAISGGHRRFDALLGIGILVGLIASLPEQILRLVNAYTPLGPPTPFWALQARVSWGAPFWLYMAVGSFIMVPILEELYTRGYLLGRMRESFSPGGSLLVMALFFTLAHGQYRHVNAIDLAGEATLLVWAFVIGYGVLRTGSLVPAIIAHVIINIPMEVGARWVELVATVLAIVLWRHAVSSWAAEIMRVLRSMNDWLATSLALVAVSLMLVSIGMEPRMPYLWLVVFGAAGALGLRRRSPWAVTALADPVAPDKPSAT